MTVRDVFAELVISCNEKSNKLSEVFACLNDSCEMLPSLYRSRFPIKHEMPSKPIGHPATLTTFDSPIPIKLISTSNIYNIDDVLETGKAIGWRFKEGILGAKDVWALSVTWDNGDDFDLIEGEDIWETERFSDKEIVNSCLDELSVFKLDCTTKEGKTNCRWCKGEITPETVSPEDREAHAECHTYVAGHKIKYYDSKLDKFMSIINHFPQLPNDGIIHLIANHDKYGEDINIMEWLTNLEPINWDNIKIVSNPALENITEDGYISVGGVPISFITDGDIIELVYGTVGDSGHIVGTRLENEFPHWEISWANAMNKLRGDLPERYLKRFSDLIEGDFDLERYVEDHIEGETKTMEGELDRELSKYELVELEANMETDLTTQFESFYNNDSFRPTNLGKYINFDDLTESVLEEVLSDNNLSGQDMVDWLNYIANNFKINNDFPFYKIVDNEFVYLSFPNIH